MNLDSTRNNSVDHLRGTDQLNGNSIFTIPSEQYTYASPDSAPFLQDDQTTEAKNALFDAMNASVHGEVTDIIGIKSAEMSQEAATAMVAQVGKLIGSQRDFALAA